ncbi:MAG: hypothetical protein U0610_03820 [bacterium]
MKLIVAMCSTSRSDELHQVLLDLGVEGYTEIGALTGAGKTGRKLGTRMFPGTTTMTWTVVPDDRVDAIMSALGALAERCYPAEGLHAFVLCIERAL